MERLQEKLPTYEKKANLENTILASFHEACADPSFYEFVSHLSLKEEELAKYTSLLQDSFLEYQHCKHCKHLLECQNPVAGHVYLPKVDHQKLIFFYQKCRLQKKREKETKYFDYVSCYGEPKEIREACMKNIYLKDKNRLPIIQWIDQFIENYSPLNSQKGLYLCGNFGCGKTYLLSAMLNELAKQKIKSAILFWPEFLNQLKGNLETSQEKIEKLKKIPILLLDDIGAENTTPWSRDDVLAPILQYRMTCHLPTFFTSNLDFNALEEHFSITSSGVEMIKARRIMERIRQLADYKEMISKNFRN